jgi:hypothetical protein
VARISGTTASYISWKKTVDKVLESTYAITIEDAGIGDQQMVRHWKDRESPEEFVSWFGAKYDLQPMVELS